MVVVYFAFGFKKIVFKARLCCCVIKCTFKWFSCVIERFRGQISFVLLIYGYMVFCNLLVVVCIFVVL